MLRVNNIWVSAFIVFVASACSLIIELVAGRIMAPYVGVSLYTWTSIIGIVLAGISIGNFIGGWIADRWGSRRTLGTLLFLSGLASLDILVMMTLLDNTPFKLSLVPKILMLSAAIFFPPSCVLGTISPVIVKLTLENLSQTGNVVGRIYAVSALGSIVGTFLTGFVLIAWMGTRTIVFMVAIILVAMAVLFGEWRKTRADQATLALFVLFFAWFAYSQVSDGALHSRYLKETNYYSIRVNDTPMSDGTVRKDLVLDHLIHSYNWVEDPTRLEYGYEKVYAEVVSYLAHTRSSLKTLFIGGGGYTFPRYLEAAYPQSSIDVVEIDPGVTQTAYEKLGLRPDTRIRTFNEDARMYFDDMSASHSAAGPTYDLVMGDAFNDLSVPYHLTTYQFNEKVKRVLEPGGFYMVNVIDDYRQGDFMRAYMNTLTKSFAHVYLLGLGSAWTGTSSSTYVVLAGDTELNAEQLKTVASENGTRTMTTAIMPDDQLQDYLRQGRQIVLTDEYAPVDNLMAPLFVQRGF